MLLYYVGDIYSLTSTWFSPLYTPDGSRSDWGKLQEALRRGEDVKIEQAPMAFRRDTYWRAAEFITKTARSSNGWLYGVGNYDTPPEHLDLLIEGVLSKLHAALGLDS